MSYRRAVLRAAVVLMLFTLVGSLLLNVIFRMTHDRIADNERKALLKSLHVLVPPEAYDNDLLDDKIQLPDAPELGDGEPVTVYRARKNLQITALVMECIAPDGYSGRVHMLVAIDHALHILGVRVVEHHETPGLGDAIEAERSPWILNFNGMSLQSPSVENWAVKRDSGAFDQITSATISSRAVVGAVKRCLQYAVAHQNKLFRPG